MTYPALVQLRSGDVRIRIGIAGGGADQKKDASYKLDNSVE